MLGIGRRRSAHLVESDPASAPGRIPEGERVYAIGDIHGRLDLLEPLIEAIIADNEARAPARATIVFLGDYIDRGRRSREVVEFLLGDPAPGFALVTLLGNHEESLLTFLDDPERGAAWLDYGGAETLRSYGVKAPRGGRDAEGRADLQAGLRAALPDDHLEFMRGLSLSHEVGDYLFVHAGVRPGRSLAAQLKQDLIWIRDEFLVSAADHGRVIVHGHTIAFEPEIHDNRIGIDTGAFMSNVLTCLVLEGAAYWLIRT